MGLSKSLRGSKPVMAPAVWLGLEYCAVGVGLLKKDSMFAAVLAAIGGIWLLWAVMKAIVKRWPKMESWLPVGAQFAVPEDLLSSHLSGKTFRIATIAEHGRIRDRTFEDCTLIGPAVIAAEGYLSVDAPEFIPCLVSTPDKMLWPIPEDKKALEGALICTRCHFRRCRFVNIGIVDDGSLFERTSGFGVSTDEGFRPYADWKAAQLTQPSLGTPDSPQPPADASHP